MAGRVVLATGSIGARDGDGLAAFTFLTPVYGLIAGVVRMADPVSGGLLIGLIGVALGLWLVKRR